MHYLKLLTTQVSHTSEITTQGHGRALTAHLSISCALYGSIQGAWLNNCNIQSKSSGYTSYTMNILYVNKFNDNAINIRPNPLYKVIFIYMHLYSIQFMLSF